jgi:hypothetical protein
MHSRSAVAHAQGPSPDADRYFDARGRRSLDLGPVLTIIGGLAVVAAAIVVWSVEGHYIYADGPAPPLGTSPRVSYTWDSMGWHPWAPTLGGTATYLLGWFAVLLGLLRRRWSGWAYLLLRALCDATGIAVIAMTASRWSSITTIADASWAPLGTWMIAGLWASGIGAAIVVVSGIAIGEGSVGTRAAPSSKVA